VTQPYNPEDDPDLVAYQAAQATEYGTWVAAQDIYVGNACAYRAGDPVPISNVERHGYERNSLVVKRDSDEGRALTGEPAPEPETAAATKKGGENTATTGKAGKA